MELSILNLLLVLIVAWVAGRVASRFGYPTVLGELLAGIVLGPPLLGWLEGSEALGVLAEVGIILMMVYIGMEIDPRELGKASKAGFLAAVGGFVTPFVLCYFVVIAAGGSVLAAIFVGVAAGVTSLATKSRILVDLQLLDTRIAHVMMAGALIADTVSLVIFAAVLGVAEAGSLDAVGLLIVVAKAIAFFVVAGFVGLKVLPLLGRGIRTSKTFARTSTFMLVLIVALVFAEMAHLAGMHGILGAFVAGLFLREGVFGRSRAHELMSVVRDASIGFLAPIFFVTAGFAVSLDVFRSDLELLVLVVGLATVGKIAGTALFYLPSGHGWREGLTVGAGMNGRGAVEIIIAQIGLTMGLITAEIFSILVFMAIFTTATVPVFLKWGTDWLRRRGELVRSKDERTGVVIVGGGPVALTLAAQLAKGQEVAIVDTNPEHCDAAEAAGLPAVHGNALEEGVLDEAGAASARAAVLMTPNPEVNALTAQLARTGFMIPEIIVLGSSPGSGVSSMMRALGAATLFGDEVDLVEWDHVVQHNPANVAAVEVDGAIPAADFVASHSAALPLVLLRGDEVHAFHDKLNLLPGDSVVVANAEAAPAAQTVRDRFDELLETAPILELDEGTSLEEFFQLAASGLAGSIGVNPSELAAHFAEREAARSSVVVPGLAIPHVLVEGFGKFAFLMARSRSGIDIPGEDKPVRIIFALVSTQDQRTMHLRALSAISQIVQRPGFDAEFAACPGTEEIRRLLRNAERRRFRSE